MGFKIEFLRVYSNYEARKILPNPKKRNEATHALSSLAMTPEAPFSLLHLPLAFRTENPVN